MFGWAAAALVPSARRAVRRNLREIRGPARLRDDARDVLATFSNYASCLAEVLSNDAEGGPRTPHATIIGEEYMRATSAAGKGIVIVTAGDRRSKRGGDADAVTVRPVMRSPSRNIR